MARRFLSANGGIQMKAEGDEALRFEGIARRYRDLIVIEDVDFTLKRGQTAALLGPSGSGKSSLLHIAGLLEAPSAGEVYVGGVATSKLSDAERTGIRRNALGFVYQFHHLLPEFTAVDNVALPRLIAGEKKDQADKQAAAFLTALGLGERLTHQPGQLSGGEQQRTAIARALVNKPDLLLADEPTGNLDPKTSDVVFDALLEIVREEGLAALIATHDQRLANRMDRIIRIEDRGLVEVTREPASV